VSDNVTIPKWLARLACDFLRDHEERLGCDGCNDYDLPEWVPSGELVREIAKLNHESEEDAVCSLGFNTSVCGAVASMLGTAAGVSS